MKCPVDNSHLQEIKDKGFSYHQCPGCKGIWIQERALRTLVEQIDPDAEISIPHPDDFGLKRIDTNKVTKCPHDGQWVYEHKIGKVSVDICPACSGIWLDPGEFDAIKGELEHHEIPGLIGKLIVHSLGHLVHFNWAEDEDEEEDGEEAEG